MNVINYLRQSADKFPHKAAFIDKDKSVTFAELYAQAKSIGSSLAHTLNVTNKPIVVMIDRNVESVCCFFGVAMSRNFYVPIDQSLPVQRIKVILEQMMPSAIITNNNLPSELDGNISVPVLDYSDLVSSPADEAELKRIQDGALDTDPLYAICTSGSTGVPKGVLISHRSVMDFIPVFCETFGFDENEVFGNQAPFDFDVSVKDIYSTLFCGATMYIIPKVCFSMPKLLVQALDEQRITTITWAVSALCIVAGVNAFKSLVPKHIKKVLFSGEVMPIKMLNVWRSYYPDAMFVNLYGPTEITCNCMYYIVDREFDNSEKLPLGRSFMNENVVFLNEDNREIGVGETGEICVTGTCLALGYYRNPKKTQEAFVQNPLNNDYPEMMYRTGDLAELREDGNYYFAARKDFQIKHMGHRIELEEIEMFINAVDGVSRCSTLFDEVRNKIVAFYVGDKESAEIIKDLKKDLPKYMIPNIFIRMDNLPITKNGKIDRQLLKKNYEESKS